MEKLKGFEQQRFWWRGEGETGTVCSTVSRPGDDCPQCRTGALVYDGLFVLFCPACGHVVEGGAFT